MTLNRGLKWLHIWDIYRSNWENVPDLDGSGEKSESVAVRVGGRHLVLKVVAGFGYPLSGGYMYGDVTGCVLINSIVEHAGAGS